MIKVADRPDLEPHITRPVHQPRARLAGERAREAGPRLAAGDLAGGRPPRHLQLAARPRRRQSGARRHRVPWLTSPDRGAGQEDVVPGAARACGRDESRPYHGAVRRRGAIHCALRRPARARPTTSAESRPEVARSSSASLRDGRRQPAPDRRLPPPEGVAADRAAGDPLAAGPRGRLPRRVRRREGRLRGAPAARARLRRAQDHPDPAGEVRQDDADREHADSGGPRASWLGREVRYLDRGGLGAPKTKLVRTLLAGVTALPLSLPLLFKAARSGDARGSLRRRCSRTYRPALVLTPTTGIYFGEGPLMGRADAEPGADPGDRPLLGPLHHQDGPAPPGGRADGLERDDEAPGRRSPTSACRWTSGPCGSSTPTVRSWAPVTRSAGTRCGSPPAG